MTCDAWLPLQALEGYSPMTQKANTPGPPEHVCDRCLRAAGTTASVTEGGRGAGWRGNIPPTTFLASTRRRPHGRPCDAHTFVDDVISDFQALRTSPGGQSRWFAARVTTTPRRGSSSLSRACVPPYTEGWQTTWSPAESRELSTVEIAAMPEEQTSAASAPSRSASRPDRCNVVGLLLLHQAMDSGG